MSLAEHNPVITQLSGGDIVKFQLLEKRLTGQNLEIPQSTVAYDTTNGSAAAAAMAAQAAILGSRQGISQSAPFGASVSQQNFMDSFRQQHSTDQGVAGATDMVLQGVRPQGSLPQPTDNQPMPLDRAASQGQNEGVKDSAGKRKRSSKSPARSPGSAGETLSGKPAQGNRPTPTRLFSATKPTARAAASKAATNQKGQTRLNAYFPHVDGSSRDCGDGSSRDSEPASMTHSATAGPAIAGQLTGAVAAAATASISAGFTPFQRQPLSCIPENSPAMLEQLSQLQGLLRAKDQELQALQEEHRQREAALQAQLEAASVESSGLRHSTVMLQQSNQQLLQEVQEAHKAAAERDSKLRAEVCRMVQQAAKAERLLQRMVLASNSLRLGTVGVHRTGPMQLQEVWEEGQAFQQLTQRQAALAQHREDVEAARKALRKKLPLPGGARAAASAVAAGDGASTSGRPVTGEDSDVMTAAEFIGSDEVFKVRLAVLKREEEALRQEEERLNADKFRHVRALKRVRDEDSSRFNNFAVLNKRYVLLNLLGKGGFSEVYKAYDLRELRTVACKIHQLNSQWNEHKKQSYVKHAIREYEIHKALRHPHIVGLFDIIEIDNNTFATLLVFCEGEDLDTLLREHHTLPEKEARSILAQIFSGLVYLNQPGRRIIHYDLKPANIMFNHLGQALITDFGLSKIVEEGQTMGMELTSQGAGTYWYLPPECFETGGLHAPKISNKVDVWSVGVIFYQMLFGRRPFGEGLTQEQIMRERVMLNAREVEFPAKPSVSAEAKEFIRKCLAYRQELRWDVLSAAQDPYLKPQQKKGSSSSAEAS